MSVDPNNSAYFDGADVWPTLTASSRITVGYRYARRGSTQSTGTVAAAYAGGGDPLNQTWFVRHTGTSIVFGYGDGASQVYSTYTFTETKGPHSVVCVFDFFADTRRMFYDGREVTGALTDTGAWTTAPGTNQTWRNLFAGRSISGNFNFCDFPIEDFWLAEAALPNAAPAAARFHFGADPTSFCVPSRWYPLRDLSGYDAAAKVMRPFGDRTGLRAGPVLRGSANENVFALFPAAGGGGSELLPKLVQHGAFL